jgi:hypothetical protein
MASIISTPTLLYLFGDDTWIMSAIKSDNDVISSLFTLEALGVVFPWVCTPPIQTFGIFDGIDINAMIRVFEKHLKQHFGKATSLKANTFTGSSPEPVNEMVYLINAWFTIF